MPEPAPEVSVFGAAHIDVEMRLLSGWHEAASNPVSRYERIGGVASNVATHLAKSCNTHLYTALGADSQGQTISSKLSEHGIKVNSFATGHRTGTYIAVIEANGELRVGLADTAAIEAVQRQHLQQFEQQNEVDFQQQFRQQQAICFDCNCSESLISEICLAVQQTQYSHPQGQPQQNPKSSALPGTRPLLAALGVSPAKISKLLAHAAQIDILFANRAEVATLAESDGSTPPETLLMRLAQRGFRQIVATDGANNTTVLSAGTVNQLAVPSLTTHPAGGNSSYSVNGAGDALAAATIAALLQHNSLISAVRDFGFSAARKQMFSPFDGYPNNMDSKTMDSNNNC